MTRAIVIKTVGDPEMSGAIMDGMTKVIPLNSGELESVKQGYEKLQAREAIRFYGDSVRWERTRRKLARKYSTKPVGRARGAVLGVWGLLWLGVRGMREYFSTKKRKA